jgi:hypothetical protein
MLSLHRSRHRGSASPSASGRPRAVVNVVLVGGGVLEEAEVKFAYYKDWCRFPIDPVLHPVWEELVMLSRRSGQTWRRACSRQIACWIGSR